MNTLDVTERNTLEKIPDIKEKNPRKYKGMLGRTLWKNEISQT